MIFDRTLHKNWIMFAFVLFLMMQAPAFATVSSGWTADGLTLWENSSQYAIKVSNDTTSAYGTLYQSYDMIWDNASSYLATAFESPQFCLINATGDFCKYVKDDVTPTNCLVDEDGPYRATAVCNFSGTVYNKMYFYDEFYVGRLTTVNYAGSYNEGLKIYDIVTDNNVTAGKDKDGIGYVFGSKSTAANLTTSSAVTSQHDTFDQSSNWWSSWYGGVASTEITYGKIGAAKPSGASDLNSTSYDVEPVGADGIYQIWIEDGINHLANYDDIYTIGVITIGNTYNTTRDLYYVYQYPAIIDNAINITSLGFNNKTMAYELTHSKAENYSTWNVTGNASWNKTAEKLYFVIYNTTKDKQLFISVGGEYNLLLSNTSMQWETNGSYYNAIFPITQNRSNETTYYFGKAVTDDDNDGWNSTYDCNDLNATLRPIANNTRTDINTSITLCPGTYYNASMHTNTSNLIFDGNGANLTSTYDCSSQYITGLFVNDTAYNTTFRNFITDGLCEALQSSADTTNLTIYNNTIIRSKYAGLILSSNISNEYSLIYNNTIMHQWRSGGEQIGIHTFTYASGGGYKIYNNTIHNITQSGSYGYGIYLRDLYSTGTGNISAYNNTITNCNRGFYLTGGSQNRIYNNTITNMTAYGILGNGISTNISILNNTFQNISLRGVYLLSISHNYTVDGNEFRNVATVVRCDGDDLTLSNNRAYNASYGYYGEDDAERLIASNNYFQDIVYYGFLAKNQGYEYSGNIVNNSSIAYATDTSDYYVGATYTNNIDFNTINVSFYSFDDDTYITNHTSDDENYDGYLFDVSVRNLTSSPPAEPMYLKESGNYLNLTNTTAYGSEYADIKLYYNKTYVCGLMNESTLKLYHYNGTDWENVTDTGVNETGGYVYGNNLTQFSEYGIFGEPLMLIEIISPQPITYVGIYDLPLNVISANGLVDTWWYSINGSANTTFTPNTTLPTLTAGTYNLTVYANCTLGVVYSDSVVFAIRDTNVCDSFPVFSILPWLLLLIVIVSALVIFANGNATPGQAIFFLAVGAVLILAILQYGGTLCG